MRPPRAALAFGLAAVLALAGACSSGPPERIDPAAHRALPPPVVPADDPALAYERAFVFGDTGTGRPDQYLVAEALAARARARPIDFMLLTGDNFYMHGVRTVDDPQWRTAFEDVYADPALQVPAYASLGNHDWKWNPAAQIEYAKTSPRWRMDDFYYAFSRALRDGTAVDFFAIDSTPIHQRKDSAAQLAWLDAALAASTARWKIVFGHHPLYSHCGSGSDAAMIDALEPIFTRRGVDVYFCGHNHALEMLKPIAGVHYVVTGAGAGPDMASTARYGDTTLYAATLGGFVELRIARSELVLEFVRLDARTQYCHVIRKA